MKIIISALFVFVYSFSFSQSNQVDTIYAKTTIEWNKETESFENAKKRLIDLATREALETEYGTALVYSNDLSISTKKVNGVVSEETSMDMNSSSVIKGEIIEILKDTVVELPKKKKDNDNKNTFLKCTFIALSREIKTPKIEIKALPINNLSEKEKMPDYFYVGDQFYLNFKSAVSGYIYVFFDDGKNAQRILPYSNMDSKFENGVKVEADKEYIFFSKKNHYFENDQYNIDELEFLSQKYDKEVNHVYVIFSKSEINKPGLQNNYSSGLTEEQKKKKYTLPPSISSDEFRKWRLENLSVRTDFQINDILITVKKK